MQLGNRLAALRATPSGQKLLQALGYIEGQCKLRADLYVRRNIPFRSPFEVASILPTYKARWFRGRPASNVKPIGRRLGISSVKQHRPALSVRSRRRGQALPVPRASTHPSASS